MESNPAKEKIKLSHEALEEAIKYQKINPDWAALPLRLYLDGKGCDGFTYGVCFAEPEAEDLSFEQGDGIKVIVDPDTYTFVKGSTIEWADDERGKGFLVENPRHNRFKGKFYMRKFWRDALSDKKAVKED